MTALSDLDLEHQISKSCNHSQSSRAEPITGGSTMRNPKSCNVSLLFLCIFIFLTSVEAAVATTTVCSNAAANRYHYGEKATLKFKTPGVGPESITDAVKSFAEGNRLSYSSVGGFDPYKQPPLKSLTHILQSSSVDISISIKTTNRDDIASASISTFSFKCGRTEDWHPYWAALKSFIESNKYPVVGIATNP